MKPGTLSRQERQLARAADHLIAVAREIAYSHACKDRRLRDALDVAVLAYEEGRRQAESEINGD